VDALLLLALSIVVTLLWFNNGSLALGGDFASIPFDPAQTASRYLSSWNFWIDAGNPIPSSISNQVPPLDFLFYYALHLANLPVSTAEGAYIALFSYFLPAISMYSLVIVLFEERLQSNRLAGFVAGAFAILNPIYVYSTGSSSILNSAVSRVSLPLALFLLVAGFKKRDLRYALGLGLSTLLMFSVFARAVEVGFFLLIAIALAIPHLITALRRGNLAPLKFSAFFLMISFITFVTVNLFWIAPFFSDYTLFYQKLSAFPTSIARFESQFTTPQNILRLQGYWPFYVGGYVPYASFFSNPLVNAVTYLVPVIVFAGLFSLRKFHAESLSLFLLLVILIVLGVGTNLPFNIFETLIQLPLLKFYKDPWIFLEALSLIYSLLFGIGISTCAVTMRRLTKHRILPKVASFALAVLVLSTISWPAISGAVFVNWYQPSHKGVNIPIAYQELNNWLAQDPCGCSTMIVPKLAGAYVATTWGYQGSNSLYQNLLSSKLVTGSGANYGLQPQPEQQFLDYVYMVMARGDPLYSPTSLNATSNLQNWHFSVGSQAKTDRLTTIGTLDPWNQTSFEWKFAPFSEGAQNGHSIYFQSDNSADLSSQHWMLVWASSTIDFSNIWFGAGHGGGEVGWYRFADHPLFTSGSWTLFGFPVSQPDAGSFTGKLVTTFFIDFGLYLGAEAASMGSGSIDFGPVSITTGHVSESFIQILLGGLNVKYIIMDESIQSNLYPQLDVTPYKLAFGNWTEISPVAKFGYLTVYENTRFGSSITIPSKWIQVSKLDLLPQRFPDTSEELRSSAFVLGNGSDLQEHESSATIESITKLSPTAVEIRVNAFGSFMLILSTAFDSRWVATDAAGILSNHLIADGYANGWIVSGSGEMSIRIDYGPQTAYELSLFVSFSFALAAVSFLVFGEVKNYRNRRGPTNSPNTAPQILSK